jgi:hypothetical protein
MTWRQWKRIAITIVAVCLATCAISAVFGPFCFTSVCTRCGAIQETTEWQIPFTYIALFRVSKEHPTPVSKIIMDGKIAVPHQHKWSFCQGGGNGIRCALGSGDSIRPTVESDDVAVVLGASQRFGENQFRDRLLNALFDPEKSRSVLFLCSDVPTNGFANGEAFHTWIVQETKIFDPLTARDP